MPDLHLFGRVCGTVLQRFCRSFAAGYTQTNARCSEPCLSRIAFSAVPSRWS